MVIQVFMEHEMGLESLTLLLENNKCNPSLFILEKRNLYNEILENSSCRLILENA